MRKLSPVALSCPLLSASHDDSGDSYRRAARVCSHLARSANPSLSHSPRGVSPLRSVKSVLCTDLYHLSNPSMFSITYFICFKHENITELVVESSLERHLYYLLLIWFFNNEYYAMDIFPSLKCIKTYFF